MTDEASFYDRLIDATGFTPRRSGGSSAWMGHSLFAAWIIRELSTGVFVELGTHTGVSYFVFCQAVQEQRLKTGCYAVDTWEGEETYGFVSAYNSRNYEGFSSLKRMTGNEAAEGFSEASIHLLHIDGSQVNGDLRDVFTTWLPKMAKGGVVLLHNTNAGKGGGEALFESLKSEYPYHLEFGHGHGLGVVQIKPDDGMALGFLEKDSPRKQQVHDLFSRLGKMELRHHAGSEATEPMPGGASQAEERFAAEVSALTDALYSNEEELRTVNEVVSGYEREFGSMRDSVLAENRDLKMQVRRLTDLVDSARRWNDRSWAKRAFHKWRPEPRKAKKRGLFKRLRNSYRKRLRS